MSPEYLRRLFANQTIRNSFVVPARLNRFFPNRNGKTKLGAYNADELIIIATNLRLFCNTSTGKEGRRYLYGNRMMFIKYVYVLKTLGERRKGHHYPQEPY